MWSSYYTKGLNHDSRWALCNNPLISRILNGYPLSLLLKMTSFMNGLLLVLIKLAHWLRASSTCPSYFRIFQVSTPYLCAPHSGTVNVKTCLKKQLLNFSTAHILFLPNKGVYLIIIFLSHTWLKFLHFFYHPTRTFYTLLD